MQDKYPAITGPQHTYIQQTAISSCKKTVSISKEHRNIRYFFFFSPSFSVVFLGISLLSLFLCPTFLSQCFFLSMSLFQVSLLYISLSLSLYQVALLYLSFIVSLFGGSFISLFFVSLLGTVALLFLSCSVSLLGSSFVSLLQGLSFRQLYYISLALSLFQEALLYLFCSVSLSGSSILSILLCLPFRQLFLSLFLGLSFRQLFYIYIALSVFQVALLYLSCSVSLSSSSFISLLLFIYLLKLFYIFLALSLFQEALSIFLSLSLI